MVKHSVVSGAVIDGFTVGECIHRGGMATVWCVTRPDIAVSLLMKIPGYPRVTILPPSSASKWSR